MSRGYERFLVLLILVGFLNELWAIDPVSMRGRVTNLESPLEGAYVGAHTSGKTYTTYVMSDNSGQFIFRGLDPGRYTVSTRIPGFREGRKEGVDVETGRESVINFQVEVETDFQELIKQATNSELTESFPLSEDQKKSLDFRCGECHGARHLAKSRFTRRDWRLIIEKMDDQGVITPAADISPPPRRSRPNKRTLDSPPGSDDESIATLLAKFRGPNSPEFPIIFQPRPTGDKTRAVVTEYQIPRLGAAPRAVLVDSEHGVVWYTDWKANYLGKVDIETGEIKEYIMPGVEFRPPGLQELRFDPNGNILVAQIWAGRAIRFDPRSETVTGVWGTPLEWARVGSVGLCRAGPDSPIRYLIVDALERRQGWLINPETDQLTEIDPMGLITNPEATHLMKVGPAELDSRSGDLVSECERSRSYNNWEYQRGDGRYDGVIVYRDPETDETTNFTLLSPWSAPDNAIGDTIHNVGWSVPFVGENVIKADLKSGRVTEFPLPSHGERVHNVDLNMSSDPPTVWFVNLRLGMIVRFQEYIK